MWIRTQSGMYLNSDCIAGFHITKRILEREPGVEYAGVAIVAMIGNGIDLATFDTSQEANRELGKMMKSVIAGDMSLYHIPCRTDMKKDG